MSDVKGIGIGIDSSIHHLLPSVVLQNSLPPRLIFTCYIHQIHSFAIYSSIYNIYLVCPTWRTD
jgi:hypothetical protein